MKIELRILNKEFYNDPGIPTGFHFGDKYPLPTYATPGSAAIDLVATQDYTMHPGDIYKIRTGLAIHIKDPYVCGVIAPRSGRGVEGLVLANTLGVIDSDYTGEIIVMALNRDPHNIITLKAGDRLCQLLFVPIIRPTFEVVQEFSSSTERGNGGFGSTNK